MTTIIMKRIIVLAMLLGVSSCAAPPPVEPITVELIAWEEPWMLESASPPEPLPLWAEDAWGMLTGQRLVALTHLIPTVAELPRDPDEYIHRRIPTPEDAAHDGFRYALAVHPEENVFWIYRWGGFAGGLWIHGPMIPADVLNATATVRVQRQ
jgi:hypothetical protein